MFVLKLNRFFHRSYESHFELVCVISVLSIKIHLLDIKVGCSYVCNKWFFKKKIKKKLWLLFGDAFWTLLVLTDKLHIIYEGKNLRKKF